MISLAAQLWPAEDRIVPVVVIDDVGHTSGLVDALQTGGIHCAEVTLRTPAAIAAISAAAQTAGFRIGAGTVLTVDDVDRVVDAGAQFIVSPGIDDDVLERCEHHKIMAIPGIATATEAQRALRLGLDRMKFFPAEASGGVKAIDQLAGPFPDARFMPSGGISRDDVVSYAQSTAVFAVSGSWMATRRMIAEADFASIARLSREAVELVDS